MRPQGSHRLRKPFQTVLAVGLPDADERALRTILATMQWDAKLAANLSAGVRQLTSRSWPVVLCESSVPGGGWKVLREKTAVLSHPPALVVSSRLADEWLWAEVLNLGGYDVLPTPFDAGEVRTFSRMPRTPGGVESKCLLHLPKRRRRRPARW